MTDYSKHVQKVEASLGYTFQNPALLEQALTHPSASSLHYERLEFLGDALLSAYMATRLFEAFPNAREGELTQMKSAFVSGTSLTAKALELGLSEHILFSAHAEKQNERVLPRVLEDVFEAIVGAIYLDGGSKALKAFLDRTFGEHLVVPVQQGASSKSDLQEYAQRTAHITPVYTLLDQRGEAHAPEFLAEVSAGELGSAQAWGATKKEAETKAAHTLLASLEGVEGPACI